MGLDMYVETGKGVGLAYWRKHFELHNWMEELYKFKGGTESFNCIDLELTAADLEDLEYDMVDFELAEYNQAFVERAMDLIYNGETIVYSSWW